MPAHLKGEGLVLNLENRKEWFLGRDPDLSDFVLEDPAVSRKHVHLIKKPEGIFLQNVSDTKSVYVNGIEFEAENSEQILLKENDQIQVGSHIFTYSEKELPVQKEKKRDAYDDIFGDLAEPAEPPPPPREDREEVQRELSEASENTRAESKHEESLYDTVFEDLESESDLPLNLLQPTTLMLKVISGPNAGAEIGIEKGRTYVIGRNPESCGILFHDYSVSHNHAKLHITSDGVMEIEDLGSKNGVLVNGQPIVGKANVTPKDLISLGTTVFLIIDREMAQDTIYSPMVPSYELAKVAEETFEPEEAAVLAFEEDDWKKKPLPMKHLVLAGSFLIIIFIVFMTFFSLFKSSGPSEVHKDNSTKLKEALSKYPDVQFSYNPASGKLFLVGHVVTSVDYQEMLYRINEVSAVLSTENNVVIDELVSKSINDILNNNSDWRGVSIRSTAPGKFEAIGYVETPNQATDLSDFLTVNFPYLDRLQNNVIVEDNLKNQVGSLLGTQGFGSVGFELTGTDLVLTGSYNNKMNDHYLKLVKTLNGLPGVTRVRNYATPTSANATGINISQNYQVTGNATTVGHGYSVILNGKFYSVGDFVDGMEITNIEPKMILLEKDGIKYKIDYRQ